MISVLALVGCGAPAPAPAPASTPAPVPIQRTNGTSGVLELEAVGNTVLFSARDTAAARSYMLAGERARVLEISDGGDWYRVDCWMLSACWIPTKLYPVRLVDASDNAAPAAPHSDTVRLASAAPAIGPPTIVLPASPAAATLGPVPLVEPMGEGGPLRINLHATGAVDIRDTVTLVTMDHYVVRGEPGDELIVSLSSAAGDVDYAVAGVEDARVYKELHAEAASVRLMVTTPQDFLISVATSAPDAAYDLYVGAIQPSAATADAPRRLQVDARTSRIFGSVDLREQQRFVVDGPADGLLSVSITSPDHQASFAVVGMKDGRTYKWLYDALPYWSWRLPSDQDYMILVGTNGKSVPYSMSVALH